MPRRNTFEVDEWGALENSSNRICAVVRTPAEHLRMFCPFEYIIAILDKSFKKGNGLYGSP
ncbi:MAG: hypothetical protein FWE80_00880 [Oscillospiraceae bacterium]|nr:hypothetical protein [Oscillospiraceae bacterium]